MWYDDFKIGDVIIYDINVNYKKTGEIKEFVLTEQLLKDIIKYEDESNFHNMRVKVNKNKIVCGVIKSEKGPINEPIIFKDFDEGFKYLKKQNDSI